MNQNAKLEDEIQEKNNSNNILIPNFKIKLKDHVEKSQVDVAIQNSQNTCKSYLKAEENEKPDFLLTQINKTSQLDSQQTLSPKGKVRSPRSVFYKKGSIDSSRSNTSKTQSVQFAQIVNQEQQRQFDQQQQSWIVYFFSIITMDIKKYDQFSSEFYFNIGTQQQYKRGSCLGFILSIFSYGVVVYYFFYMLYQYLNNLISPNFRSQSFITDYKKEVNLSQNLVGFQFFYNLSMTIDQYQEAYNKTFTVFYAQYFYQDTNNNIFKYINLDIVKCNDPALEGFYCIDFSKIDNYTLFLDSSQNNQVYSQIYISMYGCLDQDKIKQTIPNNCANQIDIDKVINGIDAYFYIKLKTQQYNATSKQIQTNYRSIYNYVLSSQYTVNSIYTQQAKDEQLVTIEQMSNRFLKNNQNLLVCSPTEIKMFNFSASPQTRSQNSLLKSPQSTNYKKQSQDSTTIQIAMIFHPSVNRVID
ncbi:hypothetical protein ABPG74_017728 [Tetrahymena malaccensis]